MAQSKINYASVYTHVPTCLQHAPFTHSSAPHPSSLLHSFRSQASAPHISVAHSLATPYLGRASLPHPPPLPFPPAGRGIVYFWLHYLFPRGMQQTACFRFIHHIISYKPSCQNKKYKKIKTKVGRQILMSLNSMMMSRSSPSDFLIFLTKKAPKQEAFFTFKNKLFQPAAHPPQQPDKQQL